MATKEQKEITRAEILDWIARVVQHARDRDVEERRYLASPSMPKENVAAARALFRAETRAAREEALKTIRHAIQRERETKVLKARPDVRPSGAAASSWAAAKASVATSWTNAVLVRELNSAIAHNDLAMIDLYVGLAESRQATVKPFANDGGLGDAVRRGTVALDSTPEMQASKAVEQWCESAEKQVALLEARLNGDHAIQKLDIDLKPGMGDTNVYSTILPTVAQPERTSTPTPTSTAGVER